MSRRFRLFEHGNRFEPACGGDRTLSNRESRVFFPWASSMTVRAIAAELLLSVRSASARRSGIVEKTNMPRIARISGCLNPAGVIPLI